METALRPCSLLVPSCFPSIPAHDRIHNKKHPKWSHSFDDALTNVLLGTIDTTGEYNINYLILDIIREYHTFHQVWEKIQNRLTNESTAISYQLALIAQLGDIKMFNSDASKLIQEIKLIRTQSGLLGKPFAENTLFSALQKCMICHPVYKETVAIIHQISFNALAIALSNCQSTMENTPAQKVDPRQANARAAGSNDKEEPTSENKSNYGTNTKTGSRPRRIRCWVCK
ncbi:uncharacterized protein UDID_18637 [Ustilago sp. UG-2017a]|nr:uncharacterized protein UDID_18637 [Ustilago sp. UG-2017a]